MKYRINIGGKAIAITGRIPGIRRKAIERAINAAGGIYKKRVTKDTDFLVCGMQRPSVRHIDGYGRSRKERHAAELGIACVDWEEFLLDYELDITVQLRLFKLSSNKPDNLA